MTTLPSGSPFAYTLGQLAALPKGAVALALGCGNPVPSANLRVGERVVDLGCGGGIDTLLAATEVGDQGLVVGVDILPPMLIRAQKYAQQAAAENALFVCAALEELPFPPATFDVAISNNAFNLLLDRRQGLTEAYRVLRPGGRLAMCDTVATGQLSASEQDSDELEAWANMPSFEEYQEVAASIGFADVTYRLGPVLPRSGKVRARPLLLTAIKCR